MSEAHGKFAAQVASERGLSREPAESTGLLRKLPVTGRLDAMNASPESNALRSKAAFNKGSARHAWVAAFTATGDTLSTACRKLEDELGRKVPKTTAQGWYKKATEPGYRPIPHDVYLAISKLWGVPRGAWPRISNEP